MIFYNTHLCLPHWALIAAALVLPFACFSRNMGSCPILVWLNIVTLIGSVVIPLAYYCFVGTEDVRLPGSEVREFETMSISRIIPGLSVFSFSLTSQFMVVEIIGEMKDTSEFPKAYAFISAPFQCIIFLVTGVGGYIFLGSKVTSLLTENLPFGICFQAAAICLLVHMLVSYLIKGVVVGKSIHKAIDTEFSDSADRSFRSWIGWMVTVTCLVFAAWLAANVVPFFGDLVELLGSALAPINCWILPIILYIRYYIDAGDARPHISLLEWLLITVEFLGAVVIMTFGTYSASKRIVEDWHTFGLPFDCHCEGLWQTCACSASHPGMLDVCS